jgi:hypothetical protein
MDKDVVVMIMVKIKIIKYSVATPLAQYGHTDVMGKDAVVKMIMVKESILWLRLLLVMRWSWSKMRYW